MNKVDSFIVPGTFFLALLAVLAVTVSWIPRPPDQLHMKVTMGPLTVVPNHYYGLRFTPRNVLSAHTVMRMQPAQGPCLDITITDTTLTYLDRTTACRYRDAHGREDGSYKVRYSFPGEDDYVVFVEIRAMDDPNTFYRIPLPLDRCALRYGRDHECPTRSANLRGQEAARSQNLDGLTVVLGAPAHTVTTGAPSTISLVFLRHNRPVLDLEPIGRSPGDAVAVSMDTSHFVHLRPDARQIAHGHIADGALSFTGQFDQPSIYRVFATVGYHRRLLHTSFVVDVNPAPTPTPVAP